VQPTITDAVESVDHLISREDAIRVSLARQ
jgi:hypothetical protein